MLGGFSSLYTSTAFSVTLSLPPSHTAGVDPSPLGLKPGVSGVLYLLANPVIFLRPFLALTFLTQMLPDGKMN